MNKTELRAQVLNWLSEIDFGEYFQLYTVLTQKQFLGRDLGLSARTYQQWKELDITPPAEKENKPNEKREWVKLDFIEYTWMKMVISLRNLGYPYSDIKKARDFLFKKVDLDPKITIPKDNPEIAKHLVDFYAVNHLTSEIKGIMEEVIYQPEILQKINSLFTKSKPLIELLIFEAIHNKNMEIGIGFYEGGECIPFNWNLIVMFDHWHPEVKKEDVLNKTIRRPHLYISITRYIMDFIIEAEKEGRELAFALLNNEEIAIIKELRNKENKNIIINYDKNTGSKMIKTEREKKIKDSEVKNFIIDNMFAPNTETTYKKTNKGDLIINSFHKKKLSR